MADPSQYFVLSSGNVHVVKPENIEEAKRRGLMPATEDQRRQYDLVQASKKDPLGAVKAGAQALGEGVIGLAGVPAALIGAVKSAPELVDRYVPESIKQAAIEQFGELGAARAAERGIEDGQVPSLAELSKQKRMEMLRAVESVSPTLPRIQQELGLRTAEEIKAEAEAHPYARAIGTVGSFFVGPGVARLAKTAATRAVPALAAEETLRATGALDDVVTKAAGIPAKNTALKTAEAELAAARAGNNAAEIAAKQAAVNEASSAYAAAVDDGFNLRTALMAEADEVPEGLAPLVTREVKVAGETARKSAERMSVKESQRLLADVPKSQKAVADAIKKLQETSISSPAITSKIGTDAARAIENSALTRLQKAPGFSTRLAEADVAAARAADEAATGADKVLTAERLKQANESLATIEARQKLTAKAIGLGLGRSAELMMFGLQGAANEMALGDPALVAESSYATLGFDGGLGVGFGVAEALVPPTLRAGVRLARAGGNRLKDAIGKVYPEIASFFTGAEPETIRAVLDAKEDLAAKGLRRVIEEATPMPARLLEGEVPAGRLRPLKPTDTENASKELSKAFQDDYAQIAAPKEGGLLYEANKVWRKVQLNRVIEQEVQAAGTDAPMKESLGRAIGFVQDVRSRIAPLIPDAITPQQTAQASAYKVNAALAKVEKRLIDFEASNPSAPKVFQEIKWLADDVFDLIKDFGVSATELKAVDRQANSAYSQLRNNIVSLVTDENVWGRAGVLESQWRSDARAFYAARDNLIAVAPKGLIRVLKDPATGRKTEIVVDSSKMKTIVKDINDEKYRTFRDAFADYLGARGNLVGRIGEVADYVGANVDKTGVAKRLRETEAAYDRAIENAVNEASNVAIKSENKALIKTLKDEYAAASEARRADINRQLNALVASEKAGNIKAGLKIAAKVAAPVSGTLLGGVIGGPVGAIIGGIGSAAGTATTIALTSPVTVAKTLAKLNKAKIAVNDRIGSVANVLSGTGAATVKTGEALGSFYTRKKLDEEYKRVEKRVRELTADNDALMDQQDAMLADLADDAPNVADATKTVNATALQYLASKKPQPPANLAPMQLMAWEPIEADKRKFLRINEAVINPLDTLSLAAKGALLPEQIDALNTVYPSLMAEVRANLLERIEQTGKVPEKHRMMVSMILGKDIDGRMQAAKIVPAQSVYGQQRQVDAQKQAQAQMPMTRAQRLNLAERAEYEGSARRNAQELK